VSFIGGGLHWNKTVVSAGRRGSEVCSRKDGFFAFKYFRSINFKGHPTFAWKKTNRFTLTARWKCADKVFQIVISPKMCHVTKRLLLTMLGTLALEFYFFPRTISTAKSKLDARKENQCTALWLLNGFLSHEMLNLLPQSRNSFQAEMLNWCSSQLSRRSSGLSFYRGKFLLWQKKKPLPDST